MQLEVLNKEGKKTGRSISLPDSVFGVRPNDHLVYLAVKQYRAAQRQGTHQTKERSDVTGSTRKLHRQKGTGGSRKGDIKNPLYHGGGTIFGPHPRDYGFKMNKKEKNAARISALIHKLSKNNVKVIEELSLEAPKTKTLQATLNGLEVEGTKVLYITAGYEKNLFLSLRNIPGVKTVTLGQENTYDIVNSSFLIFSEEAAKKLSSQSEGEAGQQKEEKKEKTAKKAVEKKAAPKKKAEAKKEAPKEEKKGAPKKKEAAAKEKKEVKKADEAPKEAAEEKKAAAKEEPAAKEKEAEKEEKAPKEAAEKKAAAKEETAAKEKSEEKKEGKEAAETEKEKKEDKE